MGSLDTNQNLLGIKLSGNLYKKMRLLAIFDKIIGIIFITRAVFSGYSLILIIFRSTNISAYLFFIICNFLIASISFAIGFFTLNAGFTYTSALKSEDGEQLKKGMLLIAKSTKLSLIYIIIAMIYAFVTIATSVSKII